MPTQTFNAHHFVCVKAFASLAQSVEHAAVNRRVVGSSPTWGAKGKPRNICCEAFLYPKIKNKYRDFTLFLSRKQGV